MRSTSTIRASRVFSNARHAWSKRGYARTGTARARRVDAPEPDGGRLWSWNLGGAASATADAVSAEHEQDEQNDDDDCEHVTS